MNDSALVSIIIPAYNEEKNIRGCLLSVISQTHEDLEAIVVNNASTDGTRSIAEEIATKDLRIRIFEEPVSGVSRARNKGLEKASGKYILFLDADDVLKENAVEDAYLCAEEYGCDCVMISIHKTETDGNEKILGPSGLVATGAEIWNDFCLNPEFYGCAGGKMFRRNIVKNIRFDENLTAQEDLDFNIRAFAECRTFACTGKADYEYRKNMTQRGDFTETEIRNQLLLYETAVKKTRLNTSAAAVAAGRLNRLTYSYVYGHDLKDCAKLRRRIDLDSLKRITDLPESRKAKHEKAARMFISGHIRMLKVYTVCRKTAGKIIHPERRCADDRA